MTKKRFCQYSLTLYQVTNFRLFKLKKLADNNIKFDEIDKEFSKWVEDTGGKGEITRSKDMYCRHAKTRAFLGKG